MHRCAWCQREIQPRKQGWIGVKMPTEVGPMAELRWHLGCNRKDPVFKAACASPKLSANAVTILEERAKERVRREYGEGLS